MALPSDAVIESATGCRADQVKEMQDNVTTALDHDTGAISAVRVLHLYLERLLINFEVPFPFAEDDPHLHIQILASVSMC